MKNAVGVVEVPLGDQERDEPLLVFSGQRQIERVLADSLGHQFAGVADHVGLHLAHAIGGHLYSNLPLGDFAYPSTGYFGDKGVLLGFNGNGQIDGLVKKPVRERIEHVLLHASKVHPQFRAEYETAYSTFWERMPYSMGGFAASAGGPDRLAVLTRPDNRIYLGCAAVSGNGGWQEGAVAAAWKQVRQLHERVMVTGNTSTARV